MHRFAVAMVVPALLVGACGGAPSGPQDELTAQPYPQQTAPAGDEPSVQDAPRDLVETDPGGPEEAGGAARDAEAVLPAREDGEPRPSDAAAYVAEQLPTDALDHDVLLFAGEEGAPRLLLAMVTADRQAAVEVAAWADGVFDRLDRSEVGPAGALGTLRTPTVDGQQMAALGLLHDGQLRIAVWELTPDGLEVPGRCPLSEPREVRGQASATVDIGCDPDQVPSQGLVWHDGVFAPPQQIARTERPERASTRDRAPEPASGRAGDQNQAPGRGEAATAGENGRSDRAGGRSDRADGPPGAQGRGPRGR